MNKRRIRNRKLRRQREIRKNITLFVLSICLIISLSFTIGGFLSNAKAADETLQNKFYKSIMVYPGDTLFSIAASYSGYTDNEKYIQEVMKMNSLKNDTIKSGCYLIVPYYDDADNYF